MALESHQRATVIAACGAGKTRIGGEVAGRFVPAGGRLLIVEPTVDLMAQTLRAYRHNHPPGSIGRTIAVCTAAGVLRAAESDLDVSRAQVTAEPAALAALLRRPGRATVLSTYQSLGVIEEAHQRHGLDPWDLVTVDEAHRSAGAGERAWAVIHDDVRIPAARRLYMTATPRLLGERGTEGVGMDQEKIFGPVAYRLTFGDAITRGLLADYRVLVPIISDEQIHALVTAAETQHLASGDKAISPRMLAVQVAVLRAAAQYGLHRVVTYHHRVASAKAFAHTLPAAAALLESAERPEHLVARHVSGYQHPEARSRVLAMLGSKMPGLVVVSNAQILREGVDLPDIDAVALIDARDSAEYVAQAVGRALRTGGRIGKIATVIVPVLLGPNQSPHAALESAAFAPLWRAIRALRAHDERLADDLDRARIRLGRSGERGYDPDALPPWLTLSGIPVPKAFAAAVGLRMLTETTASWQEHYGRAAAYREQHGHLDVRPEQDQVLHTWLRNQRSLHHRGELSGERTALLETLGIVWRVTDAAWQHALQVARAFRTERGHLNPTRKDVHGQPPVNLGEWIKDQRLARRAGTLTREQIQALDALGIVWEPYQEAWERGLAAARFFHSENGHLSVSADTNPYLYTWIANRRTEHTKGKLAPERVAALEELGIVWRPTDEAWEAGYAAARVYHKVYGNLRVRAGAAIGDPPYALGAWIANQRAKRRVKKLSAEQIARLDALGMVWNPALDAWTRGINAARRYHAAHGHLRVRPGEDAHLHRWLDDQRESHTRGRLFGTRAAELEALGICWRPVQDDWNRAYELAAAYYRRTGHLIPGPLETAGDPPVRLSRWLSAQRARRGAGTMTGEQQRLLERIAMVWDLKDAAWQRGLAAARAYRAQHGHIHAPRTAAIGDPPYPLGSWLHTARKDHRAGKLPADRVTALEDLGIDWNPGHRSRSSATAPDRQAP